MLSAAYVNAKRSITSVIGFPFALDLLILLSFEIEKTDQQFPIFQ